MLEFMSSIRGVGFVVVAVSVYVLPSGWADTASNPYEPIIARNMFGIKTPTDYMARDISILER